MKVAVIGAGLIGSERIEALQKISLMTHGAIELSYVYDFDANRRLDISKKYAVSVSDSIVEVFEARPNWVFICTPHDVAQEIVISALAIGANVLMEKPIGRTLLECDNIIRHQKTGQKLQVGFNYRFYAGIDAAISDAINGKFGQLISINMILGHGNSPGMEKTWKLDPHRCGGGCLIDPGIHLLDLVLLLAKGKVKVEGGNSWSGFWNTGIEEETHLLFSDGDGVLFNIQISLNRWRSNFRLEINGTEGYGVVEGRGRSYGPQSYRIGNRWGWQEGKSQAESETYVIASDKGEDTFFKETAIVLGSNVAKKVLPHMPTLPTCDAQAGRATMELLERCRLSIKKE